MDGDDIALGLSTDGPTDNQPERSGTAPVSEPTEEAIDAAFSVLEPGRDGAAISGYFERQRRVTLFMLRAAYAVDGVRPPVSEGTTPENDEARLAAREVGRALNALLLEVDSSIVNDIRMKFEAYRALRVSEGTTRADAWAAANSLWSAISQVEFKVSAEVWAGITKCYNELRRVAFGRVSEAGSREPERDTPTEWRDAMRQWMPALDTAITRYGEAIKDPSASVVAARVDVCEAIMDLCEAIARPSRDTERLDVAQELYAGIKAVAWGGPIFAQLRLPDGMAPEPDLRALLDACIEKRDGTAQR